MRYILTTWIFFFIMQPAMPQDSTTESKPVFISVPASRVFIDSVYHYTFKAIDSAGSTLSYSVISLPGWLKYDSISQSITGKTVKPGQYAVHILASNGRVSAGQDYMLTVYNRQTTNILCLGNSITNGTGKFNSYRRPLWQLLRQSNYNFDLVGSWNKHHMGAESPDPDFDTDNDGHSGWTIENMFHPPGWDSARGSISQWLKMYKADMVLMELGTNDVFQCRSVPDMIKDLDKLVHLLRNKNSKVKIFIARIPPLGEQWAPKKLCGNSKSYREVIKELNKQIGVLAVKATTTESSVIVVDQFSGVDPAKDMYDDIHPNEKGEKVMAKRWFTAVRPYLKKLK